MKDILYYFFVKFMFMMMNDCLCYEKEFKIVIFI